MEHFTQLRFENYKAFSSYSVNLSQFNVLVGPNNAGKSTILGAFRILAEALRKARSKKAELVHGPHGTTLGYKVSLDDLPVSTENVFHNYDETDPATITFRISNGNELTLYFPRMSSCILLPSPNCPVRTPADFKRSYPVTVAFVPVLGPVDHDEPLFQEEAARRALLSHNAARNFRNIWHHYPEDFAEFRQAIQQTWPGMDIKPPEIENSGPRPRLHMFCPEERIDRELFWAGFGFQVWCQMLTFLLKAKEASLLIIDEPDIYLHADLQRQLVGVVKSLGPRVILATHSIEIISEVEPEALLNIDKRNRHAKRVKDTHELQNLFQILGSKLNPILTQLVKTRRALFVEGHDFQIFSRFARKLGYDMLANRGDFAVIEAKGFSPTRVRAFTEGIERTLGAKLLTAVIFDRDYRSDAEIAEVTKDLGAFCGWVTVHNCKELENYLLRPAVLQRAAQRRLSERAAVGKSAAPLHESMETKLHRLTDQIKSRVMAQFLATRKSHQRGISPKLDDTTLTEQALNDFDASWRSLPARLKMVPGKEVLSALNAELQQAHSISLTANQIIDAFEPDEVPEEMKTIILGLEVFRKNQAEDTAVELQ